MMICGRSVCSAMALLSPVVDPPPTATRPSAPSFSTTANAASGNRALAVNVTSKTGTQAIAQGKGNNVVAIDGAAITGEGSEGNNVVVVGGIADVNGKHDNVVTLAGATVTDPSSHDNTIINGGGVALSSDQGEAAGVFSANVCGTQFAGQGSHVVVSAGAC